MVGSEEEQHEHAELELELYSGGHANGGDGVVLGHY